MELVLKLHEVLMCGVRGKEKNPGRVREKQVFVGRPPRYIPPPPEALSLCLSSFIDFIRSDNALDPLVRVFVAHYQFEAIHPFLDGNGRVGRVLLSLCARHWIGLSLPWLYMSEFFDENRTEYFERLMRVSTHGDWSAWIEFCLLGTIEQAKKATATSASLVELRRAMYERIPPSPRLPKIVESFFNETLVVRIAPLARCHGVRYHTAKADVDKLVEAGILQPLPDSRPKAFYVRELFDIVYG